MIRRLIAAAALLAAFAAPSYADTTTTTATGTTTVRQLPHPSLGAIVAVVNKKYPQMLTWQSPVDWKTLSHDQKVLYLEGHFDGIAVARGLELMSGMSESGTPADVQKMRAGMQAHIDDEIALMDQAFAQYPGQTAAVMTAVLVYLLMPTQETTTTTLVSPSPNH
ncbi:MAG TPA: hypothetical protein V6D47_21735 [Oscillatoriaceae cyanobacterium]